VALLFATSVIVAAGCAKKEEPAKPAETTTTVKPGETTTTTAKPGETTTTTAKPGETTTTTTTTPTEKAPEKK
jgi:hypothetical protein